MKKPQGPMTAADIRALLRKRFGGGNEWAIFFEVLNATGARHTRSADAIAMNLWPSRGLSFHGFEIKVGRSDWARELERPEKAEPMVKRCDYWWMVTPADLIKAGELPDTWGLIEVHGDGDARKLVYVKQASKLTPIPLDREFVAALLRKAGHVDEAVVHQLVEERTKAAREQAEKEAERRFAQRRDANDGARKKLEVMERVFNEGEWSQHFEFLNDEEFARAVRLVHRVGIEHIHGAIRSALASAERCVASLRTELDRIGASTPEELQKANDDALIAARRRR